VLQIGRSLVPSQMVSLEFFTDIKSFRSHCGPGVDSASNRNEYQEYFLGGKGGRCVRLTILPPSSAVFTKSVNINFLEPSGPLQACNGTDLPFIELQNLSKFYSFQCTTQSTTHTVYIELFSAASSHATNAKPMFCTNVVLRDDKPMTSTTSSSCCAET